MRVKSETIAEIRFIFHEEFRDESLAVELLTPLSAMYQSSAKAPRGSSPFVADIYRFPLLSADEERHLFRQMNYLKYRAESLRRDDSVGSRGAVRLPQMGDYLNRASDVRNRIVQCNQRLVISVAKKFVRPTMRLEEVVSEANIALLRAIECFDVSRGYRFSTYASHSMYRHLMRFIRKHDREQSQRETVDAVALSDQEATVESLATEDEVIAIARILQHLTADEREIVDLRFGLLQSKRPHTFREIGAIRGVSGERIRQILREALCRVKRAFDRSGEPGRFARQSA